MDASGASWPDKFGWLPPAIPLAQSHPKLQSCQTCQVTGDEGLTGRLGPRMTVAIRILNLADLQVALAVIPKQASKHLASSSFGCVGNFGLVSFSPEGTGTFPTTTHSLPPSKWQLLRRRRRAALMLLPTLLAKQ